MNAQDIKLMFEGVDEPSRNILARRLRPELTAAVTAINTYMRDAGVTREQLCPAPENVMNAARLCSLQRAEVVILGQDPFIKPGEAHGLSFSVQRGVRVPPSTRKFYDCLLHCGLIASRPEHGDLAGWARQNVLLLNCALTTVVGKSNAHAEQWRAYTDALIREIAALPQPLIFILLGAFAQSKEPIIAAANKNNMVLKWGHPSPLNSANQTDNPKNFLYCDVFTRTNDALIASGHAAIDWNPDAVGRPAVVALANIVPVVAPLPVGHMDPASLETDVLWVFTDGGARGNGHANCRASYGYYVSDGVNCVRVGGMVENCKIAGQLYQASNNRGELLAILRGLECVQQYGAAFEFRTIKICSDSQYSLDSINKWVKAWIADPERMEGKKNLDIIIPARKIVDALEAKYDVVFMHVYGHGDEPAESDSPEWFSWKCNDIVDELCHNTLDCHDGVVTPRQPPKRRATVRRAKPVTGFIEK